jgi:hypothetical protein
MGGTRFSYYVCGSSISVDHQASFAIKLLCSVRHMPLRYGTRVQSDETNYLFWLVKYAAQGLIWCPHVQSLAECLAAQRQDATEGGRWFAHN